MITGPPMYGSIDFKRNAVQAETMLGLMLSGIVTAPLVLLILANGILGGSKWWVVLIIALTWPASHVALFFHARLKEQHVWKKTGQDEMRRQEPRLAELFQDKPVAYLITVAQNNNVAGIAHDSNMAQIGKGTPCALCKIQICGRFVSVGCPSELEIYLCADPRACQLRAAFK